MTTRFGSIVDDDYYVAVDPDGNEISRGSKKDKRYTDILAHSQDGSVVGTYRIIQPEVKVGLIGASPGVQPPNNAPEWLSTPSPVTWQGGVGGTYELSVHTFDAEGDTLTYAVDGTGTALPTGVTVSGSQLVATSSVVEGTTTGIRITVDDGTASPVASSNFDIVISEAAPVTSPTLFDDYGGNAFNGEAGALAVNDSWASTVYDYAPQFAPTIPTIPLPTGSPAAQSGENPSASDEYLCQNRADLVAALADTQYTYIFCAIGNDFTDGGVADSITVTNGGTVGTPRWVVAWDATTPSNIDGSYAPWSVAAGSRAQVPSLILNTSSSNYWYFMGLGWGDLVADQYTAGPSISNGANNITLYRCNAEHAVFHAVNIQSGTSDCTVYQCVIHDNFRNFVTSDQHGVKIDGDDHKVISCEFFNNAGDGVQFETSTSADCIVEDCCFYETVFLDSDGNVGGSFADRSTYKYSYGQGACEYKKITGLKIYGNRAWYQREKTAGDSWNSGPFSISSIAFPVQNVDLRWNIVHDSGIGAFNYVDGRDETIAGGGHSHVRNIVYDVWRANGNYVMNQTSNANEIYLNTLVDTDGASLWQNYRFDSSDIDTQDIMGNWFENSGAILNENRWGANWEWGYNAYSASYELPDLTGTSVTYPVGYELGTRMTGMGDFTYRRRKLTSPETATIPGIVPTTSTPSGFRTLVPTTGGTGNDQIGSRTGIGVDDTF